MEGSGVASQALLLPEVAELDEHACDRLDARAAEPAEFGLDLERFGPAAILVRSTPAMLGNGDVKGLVADLADELAAYDEALSLKERLDHVAATMACHGSVRAGRVLSVASSDTRRVWKACVSTGSSRWSQSPKKHNTMQRLNINKNIIH